LQHKLESQNDYVRSQRSIGGRESNCTRLKPSATNRGFCYSQLLTATVSLLGGYDASALATADVGIAIGAGTDVAIESAGIVLVRGDPRDVVGAIELSRATHTMIQNLVWATAYNLVAIPAAAGLFVRWGVELPMSVGAVAMNLSTIIVAVNAQLLRKLKLRRDPQDRTQGMSVSTISRL
jgi:magnesium-transporting ATPase (P-type)